MYQNPNTHFCTARSGFTSGKSNFKSNAASQLAIARKSSASSATSKRNHSHAVLRPISIEDAASNALDRPKEKKYKSTAQSPRASNLIKPNQKSPKNQIAKPVSHSKKSHDNFFTSPVDTYTCVSDFNQASTKNSQRTIELKTKQIYVKESLSSQIFTMIRPQTDVI